MANNTYAFLTTCKHKVPDFNTTLAQLVHPGELDNVSFETRRAIAYLVQSASKKALNKIKPNDCPFKLLSLFKAKEDKRYYLKNIYSDGENLTTSDGHALATIKTKTEPGFYDAHGVKVECEAKYPSFDKVFSTTHALFDVELSDCIMRSVVPAKGKSYFVREYTGPDGLKAWFMDEYIKRLERLGFTRAAICGNKSNNSISHLQVERDELKAVVMLYRMNKTED